MVRTYSSDVCAAVTVVNQSFCMCARAACCIASQISLMSDCVQRVTHYYTIDFINKCCMLIA